MYTCVQICIQKHRDRRTCTHTEAWCWFWSESCRVQQTALTLFLRDLVCGINEQQRGVCVMGNHLLHPRETLQYSSTQKRWQGPNDAAQHKAASNITRGVPQDVNFSVYSECTHWLFLLILTVHIMVSSFSVYLAGPDTIAEGVGVALVTDLNVVNLAIF